MPINHRESLSPSLTLPGGINMVCHIQRLLCIMGIIRTYCQLQFSVIYFSVPNQSKPHHIVQSWVGRELACQWELLFLKSGSQKQKMEGNIGRINAQLFTVFTNAIQKSPFESFPYYIFCIMSILKINGLFASENTAADL